MLKMKVLRITTLIVIVVLISIPYLLIKPVSIFPYRTFSNGHASSDIQYGGNSLCRLEEHTDEHIKYESHLKEGYKYPFSGYSLSFHGEELDLSYRNKLRYSITATESRILRFNLGIELDGKTDFIYECDIVTGKEKNTSIIPVSYLKPAKWWFSTNNVTKEDFILPQLKNINLFSVVNSSSSPIGKSEIITIKEVSVLLSPTPFIVISIILFLFLLSVELYFVLNINKKGIEYREVNIRPTIDPEIAIVLNYIGENYFMSDINVETIAARTGISRYKIPEIIKGKFGMTFPGYLNTIRIREVKRILIETDLNVLDISISVGYNTVSHFNRTFKRIVGISPLDYRKKYKKNPNRKKSKKKT